MKKALDLLTLQLFDVQNKVKELSLVSLIPQLLQTV